jgi:hypothetical protein
VSVTEIGRETGQDWEKVKKHLAEDAACGALAAGTASDRAASTPAVVSTSGTAPACDTTAVPALSVPTRGGRPLRFTPRCSSFNDLVASAAAILVGWSTFQFDSARRQRESGGLG